VSKVIVDKRVDEFGNTILTPVGEVPTETSALFVGFGSSGVAYYRGLLPAQYLRASVFIRDDKDLAPRLRIGRQDQPVVVYSMPRNEFMLNEVAELLGKGVRVIADHSAV